jgi:hypothetical protein
MMLEAFDPTSNKALKPYLASLELSREALERADRVPNTRRYVDCLLADGLADDALVVIARALPSQYLVAWCCECIRTCLDSAGGTIELERAAVALAQQCLRQPSQESRQLCMEFAERDKHSSSGAWLATAAAWADGSLSPAGAPPVPAPQRAVADAVVASLRIAAGRSATQSGERKRAFANRALTVFGTV